MSTKNFTSYETATEKLIKQAATLDVQPHIVRALRETFKNPKTYLKVFGEKRPDNLRNWSTSYCEVASYYIYVNTGGAQRWELVNNPIHWWLERKSSGEIFDITYDQFLSLEPDFYTLYKLPAAADPEWAQDKHKLYTRAMILGKCAGLEP